MIKKNQRMNESNQKNQRKYEMWWKTYPRGQTYTYLNFLKETSK